MRYENAGMENRIAMTETDEWTTVKLAGVQNSPKANMLVYWNKTNKNISHTAFEMGSKRRSAYSHRHTRTDI